MFASICWSGEMPETLIKSLPDPRQWCWFLPKGIVFKVPESIAFETVADRIRNLASTSPDFDYVLAVHRDLRSFGGKAYSQFSSDVWSGIVS